MRSIRATAAALALGLFGFGLVGCATSGGSGGGTARGVKIYGEGSEVYVCRRAHTAPSRQALAEELRDGGGADSSTGQTVRVRDRDSVQVDDQSVSVAHVEEADGGRTYWIPYTALCSRG